MLSSVFRESRKEILRTQSVILKDILQRLACFQDSPRRGTPAADFADQIEPGIKGATQPEAD